MSPQKNLFVAIWMVTYNQENYISNAIESVMMQEANFEYKLFIGEDCSTDDTNKICKKLKEKYPKKIELFLNKRNLGGNLNARQIYNQCFESGAKYVALLEGDDYWTDPLKLQKQVDFLEANKDYGICFHNVEQVNSLNGIKNNILPNVKLDTDFSIHDYILSNKTATCSIVFKTNFIKPIPNWFKEVPFGDLGIILAILKNSNEKARVLKDVMGVYRIHENGIHGSLHKNNLELIKAYKQHIQFFNIVKKQLLTEEKFKKTLFLKFENTYKTLAQLYKKEGNRSKYLLLISKSKIYKLLGKI